METIQQTEKILKLYSLIIQSNEKIEALAKEISEEIYATRVYFVDTMIGYTDKSLLNSSSIDKELNALKDDTISLNAANTLFEIKHQQYTRLWKSTKQYLEKMKRTKIIEKTSTDIINLYQYRWFTTLTHILKTIQSFRIPEKKNGINDDTPKMIILELSFFFKEHISPKIQNINDELIIENDQMLIKEIYDADFNLFGLVKEKDYHLKTTLLQKQQTGIFSLFSYFIK